MILFYTLFAFILGNQAYAQSAQSSIVPSSFKEGYYSLGFETTYLSTSANYSEQKTSIDFDSEYAYSAFLSTLYGRFDVSDQLSLFSELPLNYATSESPTESRSNFRVAGLSFGMNYDLGFYSWKLISQMDGYYPIEQYDRSSDDVLTSDGVAYLEGGTHLFKNFSSYQFHGFLSFVYKFNGFASLMKYQSDLSYKGQNKTFTFGLKGFESLIDDENVANQAIKHNYLDTVNGSSLMFASVNPSRLDLFLQSKFSLNDAVDLYAHVDKSIRGANSADILSFGVGFEYFFEPIVHHKRIYVPQEKDDFDSDSDEEMDPKVEEEIKNYNKPIEEKPKPIKKQKVQPKAEPQPEPEPVEEKPIPQVKLKPVVKKPVVKTKPIIKKPTTPQKIVKPKAPKKPISKPVVKKAPIPKPYKRYTPPEIKPTQISSKSAKSSNGLQVSKKYMGKKSTSTSPIKSKGKKPKRVKIDF